MEEFGNTILKNGNKKLLWDHYHNLNHSYFNNSVYVMDITYGKFMHDVIVGGITWGRFDYLQEGQSVHSKIIINPYLLMPVLVDRFRWLPEVVMFHEMIHAHLMVNKHPFRFGQYTCSHHGPEFKKIMNQHPWAKKADEILDGDHYIVDIVQRQMYEDAEKYVLKRYGKEPAKK